MAQGGHGMLAAGGWRLCVCVWVGVCVSECVCQIMEEKMIMATVVTSTRIPIGWTE